MKVYYVTKLYMKFNVLWRTPAYWHGFSKFAMLDGGGGCGGRGSICRPIRMKYCCEGEGVLHESWINKRFFWVIFHPVEAQEAQEIHICPKVRGSQNSNFNSVEWNNICHRARLHFCKLVRHIWFRGFTVQLTSNGPVTPIADLTWANHSMSFYERGQSQQ